MNRLREVRFFQRINQCQLALRVGVSQGHISKVENDLLPDTEQTDRLKEKICESLGLEIEEVFPEGNIESRKNWEKETNK